MVFPAISCGVYGYPVPKAAKIAVDTVKEALLEAQTLETVLFCCFDAEVARIYREAWGGCL